jgi:hypothetical protein
MTTDTADFLFQAEANRLNIRAIGRHLIDQKEEAFRTIADAIRTHSAKVLLVDVRAVPGPYSFMDRIGLGENVGRYLAKVPVAVLADPHQLDPDRIGRVVAVNRGANLEIFTDPAEAESWLQARLAPQY